MTTEQVLQADHARLLRRGLRLEYATLAWNVVGTPLMMATAIRSGSAALVGFGLDSLVEICASVVVVWQLKGVAAGRERRALQLIGTALRRRRRLHPWAIDLGVGHTPPPDPLAARDGMAFYHGGGHGDARPREAPDGQSPKQHRPADRGTSGRSSTPRSPSLCWSAWPSTRSWAFGGQTRWRA